MEYNHHVHKLVKCSEITINVNYNAVIVGFRSEVYEEGLGMYIQMPY